MKFIRLTVINVKKYVPRNATGVYFLATKGSNGFIIRYIGRSDLKLRSRLLQHAGAKKYRYFSFQITETILEAYRIECREYHNAVSFLDNKIHPRKPKNLDYKCPYCNLKLKKVDKNGRKKAKNRL